MARARPLYRQFEEEVTQLRLHWLQGRIAHGLGKVAEAADIFRQVREEFRARDLRRDFLLVTTIDLGKAHVGQAVTAHSPMWASSREGVAEPCHLAPAGTVHSAKNVGSGNGAELATYVVEKGKPLITLVKLIACPLRSVACASREEGETTVMPRMRRRVWFIPVVALAGLVPHACWDEALPGRPAPAAPGRTDFPATDSTISLLEPSGGRCVWVKLDLPSGRRLALSSFDGDCRGGKIALSADRKRGAVWFDPDARTTSIQGTFPEAEKPTRGTPRLFVIDLGTGAATPVAPPAGLREFGFDPGGRLIALTVQTLTEAETEEGEALVDGAPVKLVPPSEGVPVLVHAFALDDGGRWQRFETASSAEGSDLALGVLALGAASHLGFRSSEVLVPNVQGDLELDKALLAKLDRFAPQARLAPGAAGWIRFGSGDTRFVLFEVAGEFVHSSGLAAFVDPAGNPVKPPGWLYTERDLLSYVWNGDYLLAAQDCVGSHPRLYRKGQLAWSSDTALAVTFWARRPR